MASLPASPAASGDVVASARRWIAYGALAALFGVLLTNVLVSAHSGWVLIRFPFGFDYGEGIVWQQMRNMLHGHAYGPLGVFPAIVYHYPPVYHLTVGALSALTGIDPLAMGRAVSLLSAYGTAILLGMIAIQARPDQDRIVNLMVALLVGLIFLTCGPVERWAPLMRVDMLSGLFGVAGILLALRAIDRPRLAVLASVCFLLSIYAKQTSIAAPAAAFVGLMVVRPRIAFWIAGLSCAGGLAALGLLEWLTDGGFLRHILFYNINRMQWDLIWRVADPIRLHAVYLAVAGGGAWLLSRDLKALWPERGKHGPRIAAIVTAIVYFEIKTVMLVMTAKSGASYNYLIEWLGSAAILVGVAARPAIAAATAQARAAGRAHEPIALPVLLLLALAVQAKAIPPRVLTMRDARIETQHDQAIVDRIRAASKPVISDDMTLPIRAGRSVEWEPAIAAELGATGIYDQPAFIRMVAQRKFAMFVTDGDRGDPDFESRYNPPVLAAIERYYPNRQKIGHLILRTPAR